VVPEPEAARIRSNFLTVLAAAAAASRRLMRSLLAATAAHYQSC
jgi:hypothetical protein